MQQRKRLVLGIWERTTSRTALAGVVAGFVLHMSYELVLHRHERSSAESCSAAPVSENAPSSPSITVTAVNTAVPPSRRKQSSDLALARAAGTREGGTPPPPPPPDPKDPMSHAQYGGPMNDPNALERSIAEEKVDSHWLREYLRLLDLRIHDFRSAPGEDKPRIRGEIEQLIRSAHQRGGDLVNESPEAQKREKSVESFLDRH